MGGCSGGVVGEHRDAAGCREPVGRVSAGNGSIGHLRFGYEDMGGESGCHAVGGGESSRRGDGVGVRLLGQLVEESVPPSEEAPVLEHLGAGRVKLPEVPLPRGAVLAGDLDEAVVETQVVPDGVLPGGPALAVVGELLDDVVADLAQREHLVG